MHYFERGGENLPPFELGTEAVDWLVSFFLIFDLSFLGVFLCFNIIGAIGLLSFYASLNSATRFSSKKLKITVLMIVFLPSASFWSSSIGKDAISFMSIGLALWASIETQRRKTVLFIAVFIMFMIRPHIAAFMLAGLVVSTLFQPKVSLFQKLFIGFSAAVTSIVMLPIVLDYVGLGLDFDAAYLQATIEKRQSYNIAGGSGIDISSMSFGEKLFTYLLRPLPFEARGVPQLAASLDNVLLMFLVLLGFLGMFKLKTSKRSENRVFMWVFVILTWTILSLTTANLGIAVRQKWIFLPILIYLLISKLASNENFRFKPDRA